MEDPAILDMDYETYSEVRSILENPSTMTSFLEVLPPDCSRENILNSMELEKFKYNGAPAKYLLQFLGSKQYRVSDLIRWFEAINLQKALVHLKRPESLSIVRHPAEAVRLKEGEKLLLKCYATSYPPAEYQWFKGTEELIMEIEPELCIKNVRLEDADIYVCLVTKWNEERNCYDFRYSNPSVVEVIPADLHAVSSISQDPQTSFPVEIPGKNVSENVSIHGSSAALKEFEIRQSCPHDCDNNNYETQIDPKKTSITIHKQPYVDGKVAQGMSIVLVCEADCIFPVKYQWFKNRQPLPGENSSQLMLRDIYPDLDTGETKWEYQCEVYNNYTRALSQNVLVELDEVKDTTPFIATDKVAFLVANDTYDDLEPLYKPARDVSDVAEILSSLGFKIFACRNLTLTQMRNAFMFFCKMLRPGSYVLFFFSGHGFDAHGQTYLQTVDSSQDHLKEESVCTEFVLQCLQKTKPAMIVLLIDSCRKLQPNMNEDLQLHEVLPPGTIFAGKMENNTIYGYSTGFLNASYESDNEANSIFVKHLKKYLQQRDLSILDVLTMVQKEFHKDPLVKNLQNPTIKSSLAYAERRKLSDPVQDSFYNNPLSSILQWCDIKRDVNFSSTFALSGLNAEIIIEFHHHMKVFCNGVDIYVYLLVEPNANLRALWDMQINMSFKSAVLRVEPKDGVAVKNVTLQVGSKNLLFKKEVLNVQDITSTRDHREEVVMELKYCSKNFVQKINFTTELSEIPKLQLSVNRLLKQNIDVPRKYHMVPNSFK